MARRRKKANKAREFVAKSVQLETYRLKAKLKEAHKQRIAALKTLDESESRNELLSSIERKPEPVIRPRLRSAKKREACAVILASDWHVEERVDPDTVNGRNTYGPGEAKKRARKLFNGAAGLTNLAASTCTVRDAILWLGGDLISGHIHEELLESNVLSPTEAILLAQGLAAKGIRSLLEQTQLESLHVVCSYGNHGRTTPKRRISTASRNSFEWLMYHTLAASFSDNEQVTFTIANGPHSYVKVYDTVIRFHHGDHVRGGSTGLESPIKRATHAWDSTRKADLTCMGHFHQLRHYPNATVNGSLIGWNAFAQSIRAQFEEPCQAWMLIDKTRGRTLTAPIHVT